MKKQIITLLLVISTGIVISCGNKKATTSNMWADDMPNTTLSSTAFTFKYDTTVWGYATLATRNNFIISSIDTLPCVMLYTDTASYYFHKDVKIKFEPDWMYGYSVGNYFSIRHTYLDNKKQPLKKSIIVWQSISR